MRHSGLKATPAGADGIDMAVLPVDDTAPVPAVARLHPWGPTTCQAVASLCEQAIVQWPEQFPERSATVVVGGRGLTGAEADQRRRWQRSVLEICRQAASVDPDWFCQYWRGVVRSGVRPPAEVTRMLVGMDFLRPPGSRSRSSAA